MSEGPEPDRTLFRKEAIDRLLAAEQTGVLVRVSPPWTWVGFGATALLLLAALAAAFFTEAEVTSRARGILRPQGGIRVLTSQVSGTVAEVFSHSGQDIEQDCRVMRLDSAPVRAQLLEAERNLQLLESLYRDFAEGQARGMDEEQRILDGRLAVLSEQLDSQAQSGRTAEHKLAMNEELYHSGLISELTVEDVREAVAQSRRQLNSVRLQLQETRQALAALAARRRELTWESQKELRSARSRRDALAYSLEQTEIRSPQGGRLEAILVKPGDVVETGQTVGKLIPDATSLQVTAFLPERDRAFVHVGDAVRVELDQLPYLEFGTVAGKISRIAGELASTFEVRAAAGEEIRLEGPAYRMEVELGPSADRPLLRLRSGMLGDVRYTLRRQKVITFLVTPLRRWFE